jgi:hypothetical protein
MFATLLITFKCCNFFCICKFATNLLNTEVEQRIFPNIKVQISIYLGLHDDMTLSKTTFGETAVSIQSFFDTLGLMTLNVTFWSADVLSITFLIVMLCRYARCRYAECRSAL